MTDNFKIHDISVKLYDGMLTYPKDLPYKRDRQRSMDASDSSNVSTIEMSAHAGTHVDSPKHYYNDGYGTDRISLSKLYGPAIVIDCRGHEAVTAELLAAKMPAGTKRLLLKTDNSDRLAEDPGAPFRSDFIYLDKSGAELLVEKGVGLVGIDYLSIDKAHQPEKTAHHILLANEVVILEMIDLSKIAPGEYFLACGPLKMADSDGAPARAVLIENLTGK